MKSCLTVMVALAVLLLVGLFALAKRGYTFVISPLQIDQALTQSFPLSETYYDLVEVRYSQPRTRVLEGEGRLEITMQVTANAQLGPFKRAFDGEAVVATGVRYDRGTQKFYLKQAGITALKIKGLPERYLKEITTRSEGLLQPFSQRVPIYELQAQGTLLKTVGLIIRKVDVAEGGLHLTVGL